MQQGLRFASPPAYALVTPMALSLPLIIISGIPLRKLPQAFPQWSRGFKAEVSL